MDPTYERDEEAIESANIEEVAGESDEHLSGGSGEQRSDTEASCSLEDDEVVVLDIQCSDTTLTKVVSILDFIFSAKTMAKLSLLCFLLMVSSQLYSTVMEAWAKPTILKPRQSRPFFSNASSKFLTDHYSGNMRPETLLKNTDLLIVMYYSPWSTDSVTMKHPFEVVAKFLSIPSKVSFAAINCWSSGGQCRSTYKIMNYPAIVAYSNTASLLYSGPFATDHLFRWVTRLQNPVAIVNTEDDLALMKRNYQNLVIGYFPFKDMKSSDGYKTYAAAGFMLGSGHQEDVRTIVAVTYSLNLAKSLGMRFEGDIQIHLSSGATVEWDISQTRTAVNILEFIRKKRFGNGYIRYISNLKDHLSSDQFGNMVRTSPLLILATPLEPIYAIQDEIDIFTQVSKDYWNCDRDSISLDKPVEYVERHTIVSDDSVSCSSMNSGYREMRYCCRSIASSVDWEMACASSAPYRWEFEESKQDKRRSVWLEQVLPVSTECESLKTVSANKVLEHCCFEYNDIMSPKLGESQKILEKEFLLRNEIAMKSKCLRIKLAEHLGYRQNSSFGLYARDYNYGSSINGFGCTKNNSLRFAVLDSIHNQYFLRKWGVSNFQIPQLFVVDFSRELFAVMNASLNQETLQKFIVDFHSHLLNDYMLDESQIRSRFATKKAFKEIPVLHQRQERKQRINRLTRDSFLALVENHNSTSDEVVFFSGGNWHAPSTAILFVLHDLSQYFEQAPNNIKFHVIDTSRNELPYNFNFETVPSIVLFLAGRRDVSWKYPETLPVTLTNLVSFILSRSSPQLRWKVAMSKCDNICLTRNIRRLRKYGHEIQRDLHIVLKKTSNDLQAKFANWKQLRLSQLGALRSALRVMSSGLSSGGVRASLVDSLISSENFSLLFQSFRLF